MRRRGIVNVMFHHCKIDTTGLLPVQHGWQNVPRYLQYDVPEHF